MPAAASDVTATGKEIRNAVCVRLAKAAYQLEPYFRTKEAKTDMHDALEQLKKLIYSYCNDTAFLLFRKEPRAEACLRLLNAVEIFVHLYLNPMAYSAAMVEIFPPSHIVKRVFNEKVANACKIHMQYNTPASIIRVLTIVEQNGLSIMALRGHRHAISFKAELIPAMLLLLARARSAVRHVNTSALDASVANELCVYIAHASLDKALVNK